MKCDLCRDKDYLLVQAGKSVSYAKCNCALDREVAKLLEMAPASIRACLKGKRLFPGVDRGPLLPPRTGIQITPSARVELAGFSPESQTAILNLLGSNPLDGYGFYGSTGVGKTFLMFALAQEVIYDQRRVYFYSTSYIIDALRRAQFNPADVSIGEMPYPLAWGGKPVHLFLDELDLVSTTDFALRQLFDILSYCHARPENVTLTFSSNLSPEELKKLIGPASFRRIEESTRQIVMNTD